jgi:pimeloyl-ACP methyl ester carboxylesterase
LGSRNRLRRAAAISGRADCVAVAEVPETRLAETPGGRIAYQVVGDGPIDVLVTHAPLFPIDLMWDEPSLVRFLDRLSTFSRHVWFDPRGRGASDPVPHVEERFDEAIVDDMLALVDHLGWEQVALVGDMRPQILFAASHPERTKALVLLNAGARLVNPSEPSPASPTEFLDQMRRGWGLCCVGRWLASRRSCRYEESPIPLPGPAHEVGVRRLPVPG